jgi:hypothetical protein
MKIKPGMAALASLYVVSTAQASNFADSATLPEIVHFENQALTLGGELYRPPGNGPFPAVLYNHGSASGMWSSEAKLPLPGNRLVAYRRCLAMRPIDIVRPWMQPVA